MISDCGNVIESVKYKIWLQDDDRGIIEVAFHSQHRPKGTTKKDWTMKFDSQHSVPELMNTLRRKVRMSDPSREEITAYCCFCNTVTVIKPKINPYKHQRVMQCAYCGSKSLEHCE